MRRNNRSAQGRANFENLVQGLPLVDDPPISKNQFCSALKNSKPANCSYSSPPSTPSYSANWQPNGCGDGSNPSGVIDAIVASGYPITGGTGLDNPAAGVNFKSACDAHDYCYARVIGKASCDAAFETDLNNICATSWNGGCGAIADAYVYAVTYFGEDAYDAASQDLKCAAWSSDMQANGCPP